MNTITPVKMLAMSQRNGAVKPKLATSIALTMQSALIAVSPDIGCSWNTWLKPRTALWPRARESAVTIGCD